MKRLAHSLFLLLLLAGQVALAQGQRPSGPGAPGREDAGRGRERPAREDFRRERENADPRQAPGGRDERRGQMSPDDREQLRRQIREHGQSLYPRDGR